MLIVRADDTTYPNVLTAQSGGTFNNPAIIYITRLSSAGSKRTVMSSLKITAEMLGFPSIHDCPWHELKRPHVQQIIYKLSEKGLAPATQNSYLSSIKGVCEEAWMLGQMAAEEYQKIDKIPSVKGSRLISGRALEPHEVANLIAECSAHTDNASIRDTAIMLLLFGCGLRKAELVSLKVEDINWIEAAFSVIGKGNKQAKCFMPEQVVSALQLWLEIRGRHKGTIFSKISKAGKVLTKQITGQGITYILKKRGTLASVNDFAPHDTRRTFATRMFESGADPLTVQAAMRHASLGTTQRYDMRGEKRLKDASQNIRFFGQ